MRRACLDGLVAERAALDLAFAATTRKRLRNARRATRPSLSVRASRAEAVAAAEFAVLSAARGAAAAITPTRTASRVRSSASCVPRAVLRTAASHAAGPEEQEGGRGAGRRDGAQEEEGAPGAGGAAIVRRGAEGIAFDLRTQRRQKGAVTVQSLPGPLPGSHSFARSLPRSLGDSTPAVLSPYSAPGCHRQPKGAGGTVPRPA